MTTSNCCAHRGRRQHLGRMVATVAALLMAGSVGLRAQPVSPPAGGDTGETATAVAFVDVNLVPMDRQGVVPAQTVIVRNGLITVVGPATEVMLPAGAVTIDGSNRYLVPGLTDAHVHLDRDIGARPDFGDAPLFLSYGVTTVFNLRGGPEHLEWRERIRRGKLLAPNLYTSSEFVNEPRVVTEQDVEQEVERHLREGYDLLKFREVIDFETWQVATTRGLSRSSYLALNRAARQAGLPLVGHHPANLSLEEVLLAGQSLAHMNELANLYFLVPLDLHGDPFFTLARWSFIGLVGIMLLWVAAGLVQQLRRRTTSPEVSRLRALGGWVGLLAIPCIVLWVVLVPAGLLFGNLPLLLLLSALVLLLVVLVMLLLLRTARLWRLPGITAASKVVSLLICLCSVGLTVALVRWTPFAWRSSDLVIDRVASRCHESGLWVQSTLVLYETAMARRDGFRREDQLREPAFRYLPAHLQEAWQGIGELLPPMAAMLWRRHPELTRALTGALHRQGVGLMAGTDALGAPFIVPGISLHRELQLLAASGLGPSEVLWTATVGPATFLGKQDEFGTITSGKRADLLLVAGNPLDDLAHLQQPLGVMVRGTWLPRQRLDQMLQALEKG